METAEALRTTTPSPGSILLQDDCGYSRLLDAIHNYSDGAEEDVTPEKEHAPDEGAAGAFLMSCLTQRQYEVMRQAGQGRELDSKDIRLWSKVRGSILKHPAVIGGILQIEQQNKEVKRESQGGEQPMTEIEKWIIDLVDQDGWEKDAACIGNNNFVKPFKPPKIKEKLIDTCENCPVYEQCLSYVAQNKPEAGVWAGVSRNNDNGQAYHEDGTPVTLEEERQRKAQAANTNGKRG
jgi:hypothetical protein